MVGGHFTRQINLIVGLINRFMGAMMKNRLFLSLIFLSSLVFSFGYSMDEDFNYSCLSADEDGEHVEVEVSSNFSVFEFLQKRSMGGAINLNVEQIETLLNSKYNEDIKVINAKKDEEDIHLPISEENYKNYSNLCNALLEDVCSRISFAIDFPQGSFFEGIDSDKLKNNLRLYFFELQRKNELFSERILKIDIEKLFDGVSIVNDRLRENDYFAFNCIKYFLVEIIVFKVTELLEINKVHVYHKNLIDPSNQEHCITKKWNHLKEDKRFELADENRAKLARRLLF